MAYKEKVYTEKEMNERIDKALATAIEYNSDSKGDFLFNCSFAHQWALKIKDNKFIAEDIAGFEFEFDSFELAANFIVAAHHISFIYPILDKLYERLTGKTIHTEL